MEIGIPVVYVLGLAMAAVVAKAIIQWARYRNVSEDDEDSS